MKVELGIYGKNVLDIYPANTFLFFVRCLASILPPILFAVNGTTILVSMGHIAYYVIFIKYRKAFSVNYLYLLFLFAILGSPSLYNTISSARYTYIIYTYIAITMYIKFKKISRL